MKRSASGEPRVPAQLVSLQFALRGPSSSAVAAWPQAVVRAGPSLDDLPDELLVKIVERIGMRCTFCRARLWAVSKRFFFLLQSGAVRWCNAEGFTPVHVRVLDPAGGSSAAQVEEARKSAKDLEILARLAKRQIFVPPRRVTLTVDVHSSFLVGTPARRGLSNFLKVLRRDGVEKLVVELGTVHESPHGCTWPGELFACMLDALRSSTTLRSLDFASQRPKQGLRPKLCSLGMPEQWRSLLSDLPALTSLRLPATGFARDHVSAIADALPGLEVLSLGIADASALQPLAGLASLRNLGAFHNPRTLRDRFFALPTEGPAAISLRYLTLEGDTSPDALQAIPKFELLELLKLGLTEETTRACLHLVEGLRSLQRLRDLRVALRGDAKPFLAAIVRAADALPVLEAFRAVFETAADSTRVAALAHAFRRKLYGWEHRACGAPLSIEEAEALADSERLERVWLWHNAAAPVPRSAYEALGRLRGEAFGSRLRISLLASDAEQAGRAKAELVALAPHSAVEVVFGQRPPPTLVAQHAAIQHAVQQQQALAQQLQQAALQQVAQLHQQLQAQQHMIQQQQVQLQAQTAELAAAAQHVSTQLLAQQAAVQAAVQAAQQPAAGAAAPPPPAVVQVAAGPNAVPVQMQQTTSHTVVFVVPPQP